MFGLPIPAVVLIAIASLCLIVAIVKVLRPKRERVEAAPPPPRQYEVTLYSGGEAVKSFYSAQISSGDAKGYAVAEGHTEWSTFGGSFVVEPKGSAKTATRTPASKYKVTLFSGNKAVREWFAPQTSSGTGKIYVMPEGADDWTIIGGTFLVEPL